MTLTVIGKVLLLYNVEHALQLQLLQTLSTRVLIMFTRISALILQHPGINLPLALTRV